MKITIPKPCHEKWEMMTPGEKGRFCAVCSKTVHDFTAATDDEIINTFSARSEKICGKFNESQLDRDLYFSYLNSVLTTFAAGFIFTTAGCIPVHAQHTTVNDSLKAEKIEQVMITGVSKKRTYSSDITGAPSVISKDCLVDDKIEGRAFNRPTGHEKDTIRSHSLILGGIRSVKIDDYRPLYILDEKIIDEKKFRKIDQKLIKSVRVLKGNDATAIYGESGKNGVILISTKK